MVNINQPATQSFAKWMNDVRGANFSLSDTRFHKNSAALRAHLESHISDDLTDFFASLSNTERERIDALDDLEEWLCEIIDLDEKMATTRKHHLALVEETVKCQHTSLFSYRASTPRPLSSTSTSNSPSTHPPNSKPSAVPRLTTLLRSKVDIPPSYRFHPNSLMMSVS